MVVWTGDGINPGVENDVERHVGQEPANKGEPGIVFSINGAVLKTAQHFADRSTGILALAAIDDLAPGSVVAVNEGERQFIIERVGSDRAKMKTGPVAPEH